jgi:hypothetical protein
MINALRGLFAPQVKKQKCDYLNEFLTTKMEENKEVSLAQLAMGVDVQPMH